MRAVSVPVCVVGVNAPGSLGKGVFAVVAVEAENGQLTGAQLAGDRAGAMLVEGEGTAERRRFLGQGDGPGKTAGSPDCAVV